MLPLILMLKKRKRRGSLLHMVAREHSRNAKSMFRKINSMFLVSTIYADVPREKQLSFQDPATPVMEGIISLVLLS